MEALKYLSIAELVDQATAQGERISQIVLVDQAEQMDTEPQVLFSQDARELPRHAGEHPEGRRS